VALLVGACRFVSRSIDRGSNLRRRHDDHFAFSFSGSWGDFVVVLRRDGFAFVGFGRFSADFLRHEVRHVGVGQGFRTVVRRRVGKDRSGIRSRFRAGPGGFLRLRFGFRIGDVAYCTDVSGIPERSWPLLEGLDVFVIDALRPGHPHPAHFGLDQALEVIARIKPRRAYLTHMAHTMEYDELMRTLPKGVEPAYDGLKFSF